MSDRSPLRGPLSASGLRRLKKTYIEAANLTRANANAMTEMGRADYADIVKLLNGRADDLETWAAELT